MIYICQVLLKICVFGGAALQQYHGRCFGWRQFFNVISFFFLRSAWYSHWVSRIHNVFSKCLFSKAYISLSFLFHYYYYFFFKAWLRYIMLGEDFINCTLVDPETVVCNGTTFKEPEAPLNIHDQLFWIYIGVYCALVLFAGEYFFFFFFFGWVFLGGGGLKQHWKFL